jgi:hypothetical protein
MNRQDILALGLPRYYTVKRTNLANASGAHVADGLMDDNIYGEPRLRCIWNLLNDLEKVKIDSIGSDVADFAKPVEAIISQIAAGTEILHHPSSNGGHPSSNGGHHEPAGYPGAGALQHHRDDRRLDYHGASKPGDRRD